MYYAYMRVSTKTQMENNGLEMQQYVIDKYCKENNIELSGTFTDEGVSGTVPDREGLADLLSTLKEGDKVIVQNTSRLWRNASVNVLVCNEIRKAKADVISIEYLAYTVYCTDPNDFLLNGIMELLDQYERMAISLKLAKGRKARAKSGYKACGLAPIGYIWNDNDIVVNENAEMVKVIFEKYAELKNLTKLKKFCDEMNYRTQRGNYFSIQSLKNILTNDFYIGVVTHAGKKVKGQHEAIVEMELFEKVKEIIYE